MTPSSWSSLDGLCGRVRGRRWEGEGERVKVEEAREGEDRIPFHTTWFHRYRMQCFKGVKSCRLCELHTGALAMWDVAIWNENDVITMATYTMASLYSLLLLEVESVGLGSFVKVCTTYPKVLLLWYHHKKGHPQAQGKLIKRKKVMTPLNHKRKLKMATLE